MAFKDHKVFIGDVELPGCCYTVDDARYLEDYRAAAPNEPSRKVPVHQIPADSDAHPGDKDFLKTNEKSQ